MERWLEIPERRAVLFRGLQSYAGPEAVKRRLGVAVWTTRRVDRGTSRGCLYRSFSFHQLRVGVGHLEHLGLGGSVGLVFLNQRLVRTTFVPRRGRAYVRRLLARTELALPDGVRLDERLQNTKPWRVRLRGGGAHARVELVSPGRGRGRGRGRGLQVVWWDRRLRKAYLEVQSRGSSRYMD